MRRFSTGMYNAKMSASSCAVASARTAKTNRLGAIAVNVHTCASRRCVLATIAMPPTIADIPT